MKKIIIYIVFAGLVGLLAGYLIFGNSLDEKTAEKHDHGQEMESAQMWTCSMDPQIMQPGPKIFTPYLLPLLNVLLIHLLLNILNK